ESSVGALQVVRSGQSELYSEIPDEMLIAAARDEEHLKLIREIGFTAAIMVPLVARGRTLGVISLVSAESGRRYEAADLALAEELARRAALAVDNAGLFEDAQREIAEREIAEQEMRNSRDQLDVILRGVTDGITAQDPTGHLIYANDAAARIAGYPSAQALVDAPLEEVLSRFEILDESGEPLPLSALPGRQALRGEPVQERTLCFYELATGEERWAVVGATPIFDERGNVRLVVNIFRDVTEQRRAQEALQISEARFRTMIEQSPLSIQILTPHGRTLQVNRAWEELFGTDLEGLGDYNLLEDRQLVEQGVMPQILKGFAGEPVRIPPIAYNRYESIPELNQQDEPVLWTQAYVYPVKDSAGKVREVVLMHEDVSERRRAEEELIWLASFPMLNPNPIVETTLDGEPTYLNPAAEAQFPNVRTLGSRHPALADLREAYERIWASGGRPITREVRVGERFYQQTISRVPESDLLRIYTTDTTDRRRAEDAVRKSEERFRSLVQNASDIIVVLDAGGEILYESPAIERVLAYTPEERIGTNAFDYIHPEDQERVRDSFAKYIEDSEVHAAVEYRVRARDGSWHYFEAVGTNLLDDPAVGGIVVNTRDVTERRVAEETLRESEERFRATFDQAAVGVAIVGLDGNWLRVNDKLLGIVGYTSEEMRGLTFQDITYPGDLEDDLRGMRRMLEGEISTYTREKRYFKKDGSIVWINLTVSLVRDNSGEPGYFIAVIEDIGQRKEAEVALRISEEKYRTLFETMTQGVVYQDAGGRIISANSAAERILGMTLEQMQGKTSTDPRWRAIHEDGSDYPGEEHPIVLALKTGREVRNDVIGVFVPETGEYRWVNVSAVPQFREDEDTPYQAYAVFEDITERRRAEEQIRLRAREQEAVADIGRRALARGDLQTLMDYAVSRIAEVLDLDCCGILELLPDSGSMLLRSGVGWEEGRVGEATVSADPGSQGGYTLALDEPVIVEDLRAETRFDGSRLLRDHGVVSGMSVIIRRRERPFGLLGAYVREQRAFDDDDVNFLRVIANVLATAIERRSVETALIQSEELYRTVVEQAAENIFVVDVETKEVLEANAALGRSLGYTEEEIRSMTLYDIVDHERESIDERVERILALGRDFLGERVYRRKDGTSVDVEVSASAIPYRGRNAMCIVAHDITERKRIEAAMREVREAERNRIARDLHDDILQDMVYALQEIQILQVTSEDGGAPALEDTAAALRRSVEGLRVAVFELRLSETLERSLLASMQALLELNRRMVRNRYTIDMSISEDFPQELPERKGKELLRIIQEALSNARRHASPNHVQIELGLDGETAWAEVTDDGAGFTLTDSGGGVGMSSMRQRALELGGEVRVQSEPGHGARMRFEVPLERLTAE
ncbi:MAG TPA: PAS domain S-box protein, partial [Rubrobacteraceae bacterium]|nr:PAS domain S-box protein [Rubrobacteraceae bacterium]